MPLLQSSRGSLVQISAGQGCRVRWMSLGNLQTHLYGLKNSQFFLTLNPPCSLLRTLKHCCLHVQLCGCRRLWPQRSGSRRRVHHHWGSHLLSGFMSTIRVHVPRHPRGDDQERRTEGFAFLVWLASIQELPCPAGSYDTQTNAQATPYWGTEGAEPKGFLNEIFTKELKTQPGQSCSVHLSIFTFKLTFIGV